MGAAAAHGSNAESRTGSVAAITRSLRNEGADCQYSLITGDDSWAHHCDPEMRSQSVDYRYPLLPEIKKKVPDTSFPWKVHAHGFLGRLRPPSR